MQYQSIISPLVSIVIPAYNEERFIADTIGYLQKQTYTDWELYIVDDQSTDNTQKFVEPFSDKDSRINLVIRDREPKGAQTCRNIGISLATGKYIIILDSDDIILSHALLQRVTFMEDHPELDFAIFKGTNYDERSQSVDENRKWGINPHGDVLSSFLTGCYPFGVWNCIFKADLVKRTLFDEKIKIYQDFDFLVRILLQKPNYDFAENSEVDYLYRQGHTGTITSNFISEGKYESTKYLIKKTMDEIGGLEDFENKKIAYFGFFKLQLEKVALSGTRDQLKDFKGFVRSYYGFPYSIKLAIAKLFLRGPFMYNSRYRRKYVHFVMALLYSPAAILRHIKKARETKIQ